MEELTAKDIEDLKKEGFSEAEINKAVREIEKEDQRGVKQNRNQLSSFQAPQSENLIKWQLELNDILERAEHILKQDVVKVENGNVVWEEIEDENERIFTKYAVQELLRILSMYINRNTILSDYEPEEINDKIYDFGKEINDLIFMKYEDIFVHKSIEERAKDNGYKKLTDIPDEEFIKLEKEVSEELLPKKKLYPMIIREIIDLVHSAYKRALYGNERDSLRTARAIQQQETILPQGININTGEMRKERGLLNPVRYLGGKYK